MKHHDQENEQHQARSGERLERVDKETSGDMHPPRTVGEQVEQLDPGTGEPRRRDPLGGAEAQQQERGPVGGDDQPSYAEGEDEAGGETRQHFGSDVQSGPSSTGSGQSDN